MLPLLRSQFGKQLRETALQVGHDLTDVDALIHRIRRPLDESEMVKSDHESGLAIEHRRTGTSSKGIAAVSEVRRLHGHTAPGRGAHRALVDRSLLVLAGGVLHDDQWLSVDHSGIPDRGTPESRLRLGEPHDRVVEIGAHRLEP